MVAHSLMVMIQYFGSDTLRINHALKVYSFAKTIAQKEQISDTDLTTVEIAAILHDIGIPESERKYNSCSGHYQEIEGPVVARKLLAESDIPAGILERVCFIIGNHHSYNKIDGIDFQILVEADFLVNIFEENISPESVKIIQEKYFKTNTGISILKSMYVC